jgi:excisionase family DNA binding protein
MKPGNLLTAPEVARHCGADLKTIHNWVNAGQITSFRTRGRHLRFRLQDVVDFLERFGYPVPTELRTRRPVVTVIDPTEQAPLALDQGQPGAAEIRSYPCPVEALMAIERDEPDVIVVDLDLPAVDGREVINRLSRRASADTRKLCPIVVHTSLTDELPTLPEGVVAVVRKDDAEGLRRLVHQLLAGEQQEGPPSQEWLA